MRKSFYLAILACLCISCAKNIENEGATNIVLTEHSGKLISASQLSSVPLVKAGSEFTEQQEALRGSLIGYTSSDYSSMISEILKTSFPDYDTKKLFQNCALDIQTYRIVCSSITRDKNGYKPANIVADVAFLVDKSGIIKNRELGSISVFHNVFSTSAADASLVENIIIPFRVAYNALAIFPFCQGGTANDPNPVLINDFKLKAIQALDCELAALELIESLPSVKMRPNYYTDNLGISNGGGPALAFQYLLEQDLEYSRYADKINLRASFIGEGNLNCKEVFKNITKDYPEDSSPLMPMRFVAPSAYIAMVAESYHTWEDKHFSGVNINDYFTQEFLESRDVNGLNRLQKFHINDGKYSLLMDALTRGENYSDIFTDDFCLLPVTNVINPQLLEFHEADGTYTIKEDGIIKNLFAAFSESEDILSGWAPEAKIMIAHSVNDEFISYEVNRQVYSELNKKSPRKVSFIRVPYLSHAESSLYLTLRYICLSKNMGIY